MTKRRAALAAALLLIVPLSACSASPDSVKPTSGTAITHIHAVARDPESRALLLATHQGLFRQEGDSLHAVGPEIDLMSFTIGPDGTYFASGHPGAQTDLPEPAGLITSLDRGKTWQVASRGGESDFHALAAGTEGVVGFDGTLRTTEDHRSWTDRTIPSPPRDLAVNPGDGSIWATTAGGLLQSKDAGRSWQPTDGAPVMTVITWADPTNLIGVTLEGRLAASSDAGITWTTGKASLGEPRTISALNAERTPDGVIEVLAVVGNTVVSTTDGGQTTSTLVS